MRIQLELREENVEELRQLMAEARIGTYKELFSNALTILHWVVDEVRKGNIVASVNEEDMRYKELSMPILRPFKTLSQKPRTPVGA